METPSADDESAVAGLLPLASVSQQPYVSELLSFTIDRLHKEPELLRVDAERIRRQMQEVAVGNYAAFIAAADALQTIRGEVSSIDKHECQVVKHAKGVGDDDNWAYVVDNGADERLLKGGEGGESDASVGKRKGKSLKQASYFSDESSEDD